MINPGLAESEVLALGGVHWRQIRRFGLMSTAEGGRVAQIQWIDNPEYDRDLYENSQYAARCVVENEVPPDLDDDWSEDEMDSLDVTRENTDSDESDGEGNDLYPRYRSAATHLSDDIPGPSGTGAAPSSEEDVIRDAVMRDLERFADLTPEQIRQLYPDYDEMLQELLDNLDRDTCFPPKRPRTQLRARAGQSKNICCQSLYKIRGVVIEQTRQNRKNSATAQTAGISLDELKRLREGKFDGLNCAAIVKKLQENVFGPGDGDNSSAGASPSGTQRDCERARKMVTSKSRSKGPKGKAPRAPAKIVFYGDFLWPTEAKKAGGFLPPRTRPPGPTYELEGRPTPDPAVVVDWPSEVLQTHLIFGSAAKDAAGKASKATDGFHGVVYAVHATPNMLVSGLDSIAVGGIRWSQVLGWVQVPLNYTLPEHDPQQPAKIQQHFEEAFKAKNELFPDRNLFQKNDDYEHKFDQFTTSSKIPDFDSPQSLEEFMDSNGQAVGWRGGFPLFEPPEQVTAESSKAAKAAKAVTPPHEPSFWEKVGHFMESHILAIALLPAVVVANLIPGVGELADAAEVAALSTEAVEGIELTELSSEGASELTPLLRSVAKLKVD
ncbi:hypothetical protein J3459_017524 [Metarhizium acridum]|uniref:uncharacterized protein n=1 Tax=Metarhizium acridum TaxID=92637 RepID=UPI001C6C4F21|nr:hypothetical protein J3458_021461 [Metarhizium acridum]KAG8409421.1 hypothetical protein J3459_017524 [Metarhizium acridum]